MSRRGWPILSFALLLAFSVDSLGRPKNSPSHGKEDKAQSQQDKTSPDQRGTDRLPLVVQPLSTKKTAEEIAHEQQEAIKKENSDLWTWRLSILTVVALFGQLAVFIAQAKFLGGTLKATANAANAAKNATAHIVTVERAYVKMSHGPPGIDTEGSVGSFWVTMGVKNFGNTPASVTDVLLKTVVLPAKESLPLIPDYSRKNEPIAKAFLVAGEEFFFTRPYSISDEEMVSVKASESIIFVLGYADYIDQFGSRHRAGYARRYKPVLDRRISYDSTEAYKSRNNLEFVTQDGYNYDRPRKNGEGNDWN